MRAKVFFLYNFVTDYNSKFSAWSHIVSPYSATLCFQIARSLLSLQVVASRQTIIDSSLNQEFAGKLKSSPFSIAIDESNGRDCDKSLAIFVRYFTDRSRTNFPVMPAFNIGRHCTKRLAGVYRQQHSMVQPRLRYHHSSAMLERILH